MERHYNQSAQQLHYGLGQDKLVVQLRRHELKICLETGLHGSNQLFGFELMCLLRGDSQRVGVNRTIFFAR
jgi:hypothetical protein